MLFSKIFRKVQASDNNMIVIKNTIGTFLVKGLALVVSLITTPAFIQYFNDNAVLGVWYTLLSVLTWFLNFDLGIGNGIRNNLVNDFANQDYKSAKKTISSGLFSISIVTVVMIAIGVPLISLIDLNWLYNISSDVISENVLFVSTALVFLGIMLRFLLTTVSSIFYALQKSAVNNFLALCVSVLQLLFVWIFRYDDPEQALIYLSAAYIAIANVPILIAGVILFFTKLKECRPNIKFVERSYIKKVMSIGSVFFVCQILYMLIINTNDFLITNLFGPQFTTEYSFYYRLSSLISMVISLAMTPIWSVVTKAMAEKKYDWLNKLYKLCKLIGLGTIVIQFLFVPIEQFVMDIWLRENSIAVDYMTAISFACFGSVFIYSTILSTFVCGMARMKLQTVSYAIGVVVKFAIVFILAEILKDWTLVVWSNVLILLPYCLIQQIDLDRYLKKLKENKL